MCTECKTILYQSTTSCYWYDFQDNY